MIGKEFTGQVKEIKIKNKTIKDEDGEKNKIPYVNLSLSCLEIDTNDIKESFPDIAATIDNITPAPFDDINFGKQECYNLAFKIRRMETPEDDGEFDWIPFVDVTIEKFRVVVGKKDNIKTYQLLFQFPDSLNSKYLNNLVADDINVEVMLVDKKEMIG